MMNVKAEGEPIKSAKGARSLKPTLIRPTVPTGASAINNFTFSAICGYLLYPANPIIVP